MKNNKLTFRTKNNNYDIKLQTVVNNNDRIISDNYQLLQTDIFYSFKNQFAIYYLNDLNHVVFERNNYKIEIKLIDFMNGTVEIKFHYKNKLIEETVLRTPNTVRIINTINKHNNYYNLKLSMNAI